MTAHLERIAFRAVGTELQGGGHGRRWRPKRARRALAAAHAEVAACETALSRFDPSSDLSAGSNRDAGSWVTVDERLAEAIRLALNARIATGGRFDPTILPALVAAGYDRSFELLEERPPRPIDGWRTERPPRWTSTADARASRRAPRSTSAASARGTQRHGRSRRCARRGPVCRGGSSISAATSPSGA